MASTRNTKVVACLIGSLTLGAGLLLTLEPPGRAWSQPPLLAAQSAQVRDIVVHVAPEGTDLSNYDCVIFPDRAPLWRTAGRVMRVGVLCEGDTPLTTQQAQDLLAVLGAAGAGQHARVAIDPASDVREGSGRGAAAHDLLALLERKGLLS